MINSLIAVRRSQRFDLALGAFVLALGWMLWAADPASSAPPEGYQQIKHIVFILKENHTTDNYFGTFPGIDGVTSGKIHTGKTVPLGPAPNFYIDDIGHYFADALTGIDGGKMDGFDLLSGAFQHGRLVNYTQFKEAQIPNYWALARSYVIADEFFTSVHGPSFPNHLFSIAAQSGEAINNPDIGGAWGCDSGPQATVEAIDATGKRFFESPCLDFRTVADSLNDAGLSWRYYTATPKQGGFQWCAFDAIRHIQISPQWATHVYHDNKLLGDIARGDLANMTWITTDGKESEHPEQGGTCAGENSTIRITNAIMKSPLWSSTVIFISWDDFGGFYDHVPPPQIDLLGLGPRVPLLIVSPFVQAGYIEHQQLEFSSVVKFVEETFGLPFLTQRDTNANDMWDAFDFAGSPAPPLPLRLRVCK